MSSRQNDGIADITDRLSSLDNAGGGEFRRWVALVCLSWLVSAALYLTLPPSPDQFAHSYMGWRLLEGDVPYRDFIDMNWPGVMALHALATWIFGVNLWSWRAFDFALFAASAFLLSDLVRLGAGRDAGRFCLLLMPLIYTGASYWMPGQHDMSATQFVVGALWLHVRGYERKNYWYQIGTGLCIGAAMLNKPTLGVVGALLPMHALWMRAPVLQTVTHTAIAGVAALAALLVAFGALILLGASVHDVLDTIYTYPFVARHIGPETFADMSDWFLAVHFRWYPVVTLGSVPALFWLLGGRSRPMAASALVVLWLSGVLSFFIQWRGLAYHLAPCLMALSGGLSISVALLARSWTGIGRADVKRWACAGLVAAAFTGIAAKLLMSYYSLLPALLDRNYDIHLARFEAGDEMTYADALQLVRRIETPPSSDCVLLVGSATSINYLSKLRAPTRFFYLQVIVDARHPLPMAERWMDLWEADMRTANCRFAVVSSRVRADWLAGPSRSATAIRRVLDQYREAGMVGTDLGILVYERK